MLKARAKEANPCSTYSPGEEEILSIAKACNTGDRSR
jgi:hypothetical protein